MQDDCSKRFWFAFLANHRILLANSVDASGPSNWAWYDSDGVELPNEVQIYGNTCLGFGIKRF